MTYDNVVKNMNQGRPWDSPLRFALGIGLVLFVSTAFTHYYLTRFPHFDGFPPTIGWQLWIFGGMFLFGAVPAYVSARYRVSLPTLVAIGIYGLAFLTSWSSMIDSAQTYGAGITPSWFDFVLWFWPGLLVGVLILGGLEYGVRRVVFGSGFNTTA